MPYSMTGFGRAECADANWLAGVEVKTVNHRYSDISIKAPKSLFVFEAEIRRIVSGRLARGRIDVYITLSPIGERPYQHRINWGLAESYVKAAQQLSERFGVAEALSAEFLLSLPDILAIEEESLDQAEVWSVVEQALQQALDQVLQMRKDEGDRLAQDILYRLGLIEQMVQRIDERSPMVVEDYRRRLAERMALYIQDGLFDHDRIVAEAAIFADKSNITEEIIRLSSHLQEAVRLLQESGQIGRKLDFIVQELNREINTIGSKANDELIASEVILVKAELEKIREQAQNLE